MPLKNKTISFLLLPFLLALLLQLPFNSYARAFQGNLTLNRNTVILWTDGTKLKAITVVSPKSGHKPVSIMDIPIIASVKNKDATTLKELYDISGREGLTAYIGEHFKIPIETYFCVDQEILSIVSGEVGPINWFGQRTTLLDIFEGTYAGCRQEPETEMRTLIQKILEPGMLVKIPYLVWLLTANVETNIMPSHLFDFYRSLHTEGTGLLRKKGLPG